MSEGIRESIWEHSARFREDLGAEKSELQSSLSGAAGGNYEKFEHISNDIDQAQESAIEDFQKEDNTSLIKKTLGQTGVDTIKTVEKTPSVVNKIAKNLWNDKGFAIETVRKAVPVITQAASKLGIGSKKGQVSDKQIASNFQVTEEPFRMKKAGD